MVKIYCIVDNTASMGEACQAARQSASELVTLGALVSGSDCVTIGVIGDYDSGCYNNFQGGYELLRPGDDHREAWMRKYLDPRGGAGTQEAYRTCLNFLLTEKPGILFLFLDAPPHSEPFDDEGKQEEEFLKFTGKITDWDVLGRAVKDAGFQVVTFVTGRRREETAVHYRNLGEVVLVGNDSAETITRMMMEKLCAMLQTLADPKQANPDFVLDAFDRLLDVSKPEQAVCLTVNPILGIYWRRICGVYKQTHDSKSKKVMDKLSQIVGKLNTQNAKRLKTWIDESHDETETIQNMLDSSQSQVAYVLEATFKPNLEMVLNLGRGGEFRELARAIAEIQVVSREETKSDFICADNTLDLMKLVSHLLVPGTLFSNTVAMFAAVLCLHNAHLMPIARELLASKVGTWINWEVVGDKQACPVFWSLNFMRLLKLLPDQYLTSAEVKFRDEFLRIALLIRNQDALLELKVPMMSAQLRRDVTRKRSCPGCMISRCFTVFPGDSDVCGFCIQTSPGFKDYEATLALHTKYNKPMNPSVQQEVSDTETFWAQCHTCQANYGIRTSSIPVKPKCYDCRNNRVSETVECCLCLHKYCSPGGSAMFAMYRDKLWRNSLRPHDEFVCPRCMVHPQDMVTEIQCKIVELLAENPHLKNMAKVCDYELMMNSSIKLWKRVIKLTESQTFVFHVGPNTAEYMKVVEQNIREHILEQKRIIRKRIGKQPIVEVRAQDEPLFYKGFRVHNVGSVCDALETKLMSQDNATCMLCLNDTELRNVVEACGHCQARICRNCVIAWYSQAKIGQIVYQTHLLCPFCKAAPKFEVIKKTQLRHFLKRASCPWDKDTVYACCQSCLYLKPCGQRQCVTEHAAVVGFTCTECKAIPKSESVIIKNCPACGARTERNSGCAHMSCRCGSHWCWKCGNNSDEEIGEFDAHSIYDHLVDQCGGIF